MNFFWGGGGNLFLICILVAGFDDNHCMVHPPIHNEIS